MNDLCDFFEVASQLQIVELTSLINFNGDLLRSLISKHSRHLAEVVIRAEHIIDSDLTTISDCSVLKKLHFVNANQLSVHSLRILSTLTKLANLKLSHMWALTDNGLRTFLLERPVESVPIQELHLEACVELTDSGIEEVLNLCPELRVLDLCSNRLISGSFLRNVRFKCPALHSLSLRNCPLKNPQSIGLTFQ